MRKSCGVCAWLEDAAGWGLGGTEANRDVSDGAGELISAGVMNVWCVGICVSTFVKRSVVLSIFSRIVKYDERLRTRSILPEIIRLIVFLELLDANPLLLETTLSAPIPDQ